MQQLQNFLQKQSLETEVIVLLLVMQNTTAVFMKLAVTETITSLESVTVQKIRTAKLFSAKFIYSLKCIF